MALVPEKAPAVPPDPRTCNASRACLAPALDTPVRVGGKPRINRRKFLKFLKFLTKFLMKFLILANSPVSFVLGVEPRLVIRDPNTAGIGRIWRIFRVPARTVEA